MSDIQPPGPGAFDARYLAFLETIPQLRPRLHRYCARMTGSVLDGEDVVQEALFDAYRRLESFDGRRPLGPWLFRIAHNRCIDFLRRRGVRADAEAAAAAPDAVEAVEPPGPALGRAVEHLVLALPPMERACVLLKDVFDYSLEEVAGLVDSTVGGVKAALSRGRGKLAGLDASPPRRAPSADVPPLLHLYVERFNRQDWDGLRELIAADARLEVADRFAGELARSPYFRNYSQTPPCWRMAAGLVDGVPAMLVLHEEAGAWRPRTAIALAVADGRVTRIVDYWHTPWVLDAASAVTIA